MIVDKQKNIHIYEKIIPQIKEFIPVLEQAKDMEVGAYTYPWGKVMIQEGKTRHLGEGEFESHKKYIDIQCMLKGEELMEYAKHEIKLFLSEIYPEEVLKDECLDFIEKSYNALSFWGIVDKQNKN